MRKGSWEFIAVAVAFFFLFVGTAIGADLPGYAKVPKISLVAAGVKAKLLCSSVFVSGRDAKEVQEVDLKAFTMPAKIDYESKSVSVSPGFGQPDQVALFRPGLGCTLAPPYTLEHVMAQVTGDPIPYPPDLALLKKPWPEGELVDTTELPPEVDRQKLHRAVEKAFEEPDPKKRRNTRAVVVVYKGRIIAEQYAPGFSKDTPLIGWSMTKSITNALVGILVGQGKLSLDKPAPVPQWGAPNDPRGKITLRNLLQMSSGLGFVEVYTDLLSDTPFMLFGTPDSAGYTASKPLEAEPGSRWRYISGSPNLVCRIMRDAIGGSLAHYFAFPRRMLFDRIGMSSAVMEPDASGTFVGSSFSYATARDWARFGLLYLKDGVWKGQRILPEGWVRFSTTPAPAAPLGQYGAYWWLNAGSPKDKAKRLFPSLPTDIYLARGYQGQDVIVVPSHKLVLVHLGLSEPPVGGWNPEEFVRDVINSLKR